MRTGSTTSVVYLYLTFPGWFVLVCLNNTLSIKNLYLGTPKVMQFQLLSSNIIFSLRIQVVRGVVVGRETSFKKFVVLHATSGFWFSRGDKLLMLSATRIDPKAAAKQARNNSQPEMSQLQNLLVGLTLQELSCCQQNLTSLPKLYFPSTPDRCLHSMIVIAGFPMQLCQD